MDASGAQLAFIVGHYKSGSTWLANLLCLHPEILGLRETHVFRYSHQADDPGFERCMAQVFSSVAWAEGGRRNLLRNRIAEYCRPVRTVLNLARGQAILSPRDRPTTLLDLTVRDQARLKARLRRSTSGDEFSYLFFEFLFDTWRPGRYLVEKTPTNIEYVPTIRKVFPRAKLIAIYRDGRDVVVSDRYHVANTYKKTADFSRSVLRWRDAMEKQLEYSEAYDIFTLSYESLLEQPRKVVLDLLDFLQLPTAVELVDDIVHRSSFEFVTGRTRGTEERRDFYRKGVSGDWQHDFSPEDMALFSELAGGLLVRLGYQDSGDWRRWRAAAPSPDSAP